MEKQNDIYLQLIEPFPKEAYNVDSSRGFDLSSIKAQYIKERLNEVFGIYGWRLHGSHEMTKDGVLYIGKLSIEMKNEGKSFGLWHEIESVGFAKVIKNNLGDAYKGSMTDCLCKAASNIGVGNEVFKGNIEPSWIKSDTVQNDKKNNNFNSNSRAKKEPNKKLSDIPNHEYFPPFKKFSTQYPNMTIAQIAPTNFEDLNDFAEWLSKLIDDNKYKGDMEQANDFIDRVLNLAVVSAPNVNITTEDIPFETE